MSKNIRLTYFKMRLLVLSLEKVLLEDNLVTFGYYLTYTYKFTAIRNNDQRHIHFQTHYLAP